MRCLGNNLKITIDNVTLSYHEEGPDEAPVVIFIHGFPFNKSMWDSQMDVLKGHYRVIAYDLRGHGNSDAGKEHFSIDLFVKDLIDLMDKLLIDRAVLCGLSLGGYIALNAIEKHPERFDALILSDTQCIADSPEMKGKRMKAIEVIKEKGVATYVEESIKNLFASASFTTNKTAVHAVKGMMEKTTEASLCNTLTALSERKETCGKLGKIAVPVLILVGKEDAVTPPAAAAFMHEKIQGSFLYTIEHAGHIANLENPSEFNDQLKLFVDRFANTAGNT